MKTLALIFLSLLAFSTFAGDRNTAYNLICKPMSFESERNKCINLIKSYTYFNDEALLMCSNYTFANKKIECLSYIGNKYYEFYEIDTCKSIVFDSERLLCLKNSGSLSTPSCLPRSEVLSQLRAAQIDLRNGQSGSVDKRLTYLIGQFSSQCQ